MFWRTVGRLVLIPIAFLLAAAAAAFVAVTLGLEHLTQATYSPDDPSGTVDAAFDILSQGATLLAGLSIVPALAVVVIGEVARIRSWLYYVVGGGLALAAVPLLGQLAETGALGSPPAALLQVLATAGFSGGLVYWLVAGRNA